jgi:hypothetical protein
MITIHRPINVKQTPVRMVIGQVSLHDLERVNSKNAKGTVEIPKIVASLQVKHDRVLGDFL